MNLKAITRYLFPLITLVFVLIYFTDEPLYRDLINEDNLVEWLTFLLLVLSGVLSASLANEMREDYRFFHWFFWGFAIFCIFASFEEISYGQRVFGIESSEFFKKHSDQKEINLHNTFQGTVGIKTKHIALLAMFIYGVVFPLIERKNKGVQWLLERHFIVPPKFLIPGFLIATIFMFDFQTGYEEEIGELLFSLCFLILVLWNYGLFRDGEYAHLSRVKEENNNPSLSA